MLPLPRLEYVLGLAVRGRPNFGDAPLRAPESRPPGRELLPGVLEALPKARAECAPLGKWPPLGVSASVRAPEQLESVAPVHRKFTVDF